VEIARSLFFETFKDISHVLSELHLLASFSAFAINASSTPKPRLEVRTFLQT
jgi:hypothetical protein